jgi:putative transposase
MTMNCLYRTIGISKQSFHQRLKRQLIVEKDSKHLLSQVKELRSGHPRMSSRMMYELISPAHLGRDKFEAFCFKNGLKVLVKRSFHRTTNSLGVTRFPNLLVGNEVTGINQFWVSDITYYRIREKFYYITFILDLHSRFIVGYSVSEDLSTERTTLPALQMAIKTGRPLHGVTFHSDGGGQYYCKAWLELTRHHHMKNSMCESVYENAHAERLNGTIKNDYLIPYGIDNYDELITYTKKAIWKYNRERPHQSIGKISPYEFEVMLSTPTERKKVTKKKKEPLLCG